MNQADRLRDSALRMINKSGKTIVFASVVVGTYDKSTSKVASVTTPYTIKAVIADSNKTELINGTLVQRNEKKFLVAALALSVDPKPNDTITHDNHVYSILSASPTYCGELAVTFDIVAKRT
jgi:hypothetical protein